MGIIGVGDYHKHSINGTVFITDIRGNSSKDDPTTSQNTKSNSSLGFFEECCYRFI